MGPRGRSKDRPVSLGMQNVIEAMRGLGPRRLIITSTLSAKDPRDKPDLLTRFMVGVVKLTMRGAYEDMVSTAELVRESGPDWTIVRLAVLNNDRKTGRVRVGFVGGGEVGKAISRADVAGFMLEQVSDAKFLRQAPAISN